jgi:hypothetical protein
MNQLQKMSTHRSHLNSKVEKTPNVYSNRLLTTADTLGSTVNDDMSVTMCDRVVILSKLSWRLPA